MKLTESRRDNLQQKILLLDVGSEAVTAQTEAMTAQIGKKGGESGTKVPSGNRYR